jgi:hypothetical protein
MFETQPLFLLPKFFTSTVKTNFAYHKGSFTDL